MNQRHLSLKHRADQLARAMTRRLLSSSRPKAHVHHIQPTRSDQAPTPRPRGGAGGQAEP